MRGASPRQLAADELPLHGRARQPVEHDERRPLGLLGTVPRRDVQTMPTDLCRSMVLIVLPPGLCDHAGDPTRPRLCRHQTGEFEVERAGMGTGTDVPVRRRVDPKGPMNA
jgi:hypothetical protein